MSQNYINNSYPTQAQTAQLPQNGPNAVSINIVSPQAYASAPNRICSMYPNNYYPIYGTNTQPNLPLYPQNYNNMINNQPNKPLDNALNEHSNTTSNLNKSSSTNEDSTNNTTQETENNKKEKEPKMITPLTDEYVKSLENYLNNDNPKIRLIGAKELMERFKEDENRKDNPSLIPLLNKTLKDPSPSVRFLGLTALQLGYSVGNDETIQLLKQIQASNTDKFAQDSLLASEILLKLTGGQQVQIEQEGEAK